MRGVGKQNVTPRDAFPPFPSHYVPGRPHLTAVFVRDYWEHKPQELRVMLSRHGLAVDHQRKVVKRTLGGGVVGHGGQTFTICGDFGMILGVYVAPRHSTGLGEGGDGRGGGEAPGCRSECAPLALHGLCLLQRQAWVP